MAIGYSLGGMRPNYGGTLAMPSLGRVAAPAPRVVDPTFDPNKPYGGRYNFLTASTPGVTAQGSPVANWPGSAEGRPNPATYPGTGQLPSDYPVYDAGSQAYVNSRTKIPWTGTMPGGNYANQGKLAAAPETTGADPNRYQALEIPKNPDINNASNDLLERFKAGAEASLKSFDEHLAAASKGADAAFKAGQTATDPAAFERNLRASVDQYGNRLNQTATDYQALNVADAARQRDIVARANALLPEYDTAAQNIANRQLQLVGQRVNRYKLGSGTPRSLGGNELSLLQQGAADVLLPLEQAKIAKRYDLLGNEAGVENNLTNRETSRLSQFQPMIYGAQFNSQAEAEKAIQTFKMSAASQQWQNVIQMLQQPAVAAEVRNRILQGDAQLLAAITQLRSANTYQGLEDRNGVQLSQPVGYSLGTPGYPAPSSTPSYSPQYQTAGDIANRGVNVTTSRDGTLSAKTSNDPVANALAIDPDTGLPNYVVAQRKAQGWAWPYHDNTKAAPRYSIPDFDPTAGNMGRY